MFFINILMVIQIKTFSQSVHVNNQQTLRRFKENQIQKNQFFVG